MTLQCLDCGSHSIGRRAEAGWKSIPDTGGDYEVSDTGMVRSWVPWRGKPVPRILKGISGVRYQRVEIEVNGERVMRTVSHLVAEAFLGPRPEGMVVRHLDGNRDNNAASNLAYGTHSENIQDAVRHGTHYPASKTHCKHGHEFTPENTRQARGQRVCRECCRLSSAKRRARKKAGT